jgi:hypothetical protein
VFDSVTWPQAVLILGLAILVFCVFVSVVATYTDLRKIKVSGAEAEGLRQLVGRYEQLTEKTLDAQQRAAADVSELRTRTASIEQILRTVE